MQRGCHAWQACFSNNTEDPGMGGRLWVLLRWQCPPTVRLIFESYRDSCAVKMKDLLGKHKTGDIRIPFGWSLLTRWKRETFVSTLKTTMILYLYRIKCVSKGRRDLEKMAVSGRLSLTDDVYTIRQWHVARMKQCDGEASRHGMGGMHWSESTRDSGMCGCEGLGRALNHWREKVLTCILLL